MPSMPRSSLIRAVVSIPRSPTKISSFIPNLSRTTEIASAQDLESDVFPGNTRTATGLPSASVSSPYSICSVPRLRSREYPRAASSQQCPSTHDDDRSNIAIPPGVI
jgi:hypothetical protein